MRNLKKILSCTLALSMLTTIIPADMAKLAGIESQEIFCELAEDNDYKNFKNYIDFVTEFCGSPPVGNGDPYVWSAQQWFNYKYCKTDNDNGIFNPDTELSKTKFYGVYTDNGNDFKSYTNLEIDPSNRYDTMYSLKCALQVELLYYGIDKNTEDGDFLTIDKMYGWYGDGEVLNFFGSFGETTRAAFDQMMKDYGGLSNLPSDILRIINYGLVVKGYGSLCSDGNLPYSSGTFDDNIKKGISKLVEEAGIKDKYSDIENDFDSILLKAILNTDSYSIYDDGDDKIRELQILLNSKIYDDYIYDGDSKSIIGIGPCDGIYGRDTCKRLIYYYQKLIFEGFDIKPNGYFGEGTLMHSPDISADSEVNQDIIKLVKYAYYVNGYNPGIINDNVGYDIRTENAAKSFKSFMHLPNSDDGVTYKDTIKSLMSSSGDTNRTARACDTNAQLTEEDIKALKENGYEYVGRYVVDERFEKKRLSKEEAYNIISAGLKIIPIYQGFNCGDPDDFTVIKAQKDIVDSLNSAVKIGIPRGSTLYYAVDCDPYDEEIEDYVLKYFDELKRLMLSYGNFYEIGVYGTRNVCKKVYDAGFAKSAYVADASTGFSGNMGYQMPRCWAFDQFSVSVEDAEIYVGKIQIDKVAVSGLDNAVSRLDETVQSEYESAKKSAPVMENLIIGNTYGDPVNLAFGSHEIEYTAVSVSGAQNIDFSLSYSSAESAEGEMGSGWYHNYEKHIEPYTETYKGIPSFGLDEEGNPLVAGTDDHTVSYINVYDSPVSCIRYIETNANEFVPENENYKGYKLIKQSDDSYILNCNNNKFYYYNPDGNLSGIKSKEGLLVKVENTSDSIIITEMISGKKIIAEKQDGKISSVYADKNAGTVDFSYNYGMLSSISDLNDYVIKYKYDNYGRVISGTDGDGITYFTDTYYDDEYFDKYYSELGLNNEGLSSDERDKNDTIFCKSKKAKYGKIKTQADALGNISYFDYEENYNQDDNKCIYTFTTKVTDRNGNSTESIFNAQHLLVSYIDQNGDTVKYTYDEKTDDLLSVTDPSGLSETMIYDENHNIISKTDKNGLSTEYIYDANNNITEIINKDKDGLEYSRVGYKYKDNLMTEMTDSRGIVTEFVYSDGLLIKKIVNAGTSDERVYTYSYKDGLLYAATDPNGGKIVTNHNKNALVESYTDAYGNVIKINNFDNAGNIISENIYSSEDIYNTITHTFNSRGLETSQSDSIGTILKNTYNENGKITSVKDGNGSETKYSYDAEERLIKVIDPEGNITAKEYDAGGRIVKETNAEGTETLYEYNTEENTVKILIRKKSEENDEYEIYNITTSKYDGYGNILWQKDSYDTLTEYIYNSRNLLSEKIFAKGKDEETKEIYEYNDYGDLISVTDGGGNVQKYEYDALGYKTAYIDANGNRTEYTYDKCGNLKTEANARLLKEKKSITYNYDFNGRLISVVSPSGYVTENAYDYQGKLLTTTDPLGRVSKTNYDLRGNVSELINNDKVTVSSFSYDNVNNLLSESDANKNKTEYTYDKNRRVCASTDPLGNITSFKYDKTGNISETTDSEGTTVSAKYDALGNVIGTTDGNLTNIIYQYDKSGNLIAKPSTSGKYVRYGYNALNICTQITNGREQKTEYSYDKAGRVIKALEYDSEGNISNTAEYEYDANGNVLSVKDNTGIITRTYDELNRISTYTDTFGDTIKYTYDLEGNLNRIDYPDDGDKKIFVKYEYDKAAQLTKVIDWEGKITEYKYDTVGEVSSVKKPDGSTVTYQYDKAGNLLSADNKTEESVITSYNYRYDANSNLIREESLTDNTIYAMEYDSLNRLLCRTAANKNEWFEKKLEIFGKISGYSDTIPSELIHRLFSFDSGTTTKEIFGYDKSGNIKGFNRTVNYDGILKSTSSSKVLYYGENNQLLRYTDNNGITMANPLISMGLGIIPAYFGRIIKYDDDGNMISAYINGKDELLSYDIKNRLTSCGETLYTYDAEGNRIKVTEGSEETRYLYDTNQPLPKVIKSTSGGKSTIYVYGRELINEVTDSGIKYYHYDYRGSTAALTDSKGNVTDRYQYDVYGNSSHTEGDSVTPFLYNGSVGVMTDSNNLLYMTTRYYNPETARFISADSVTGNIKNTQSLNRYTYCEGNPVNFYDPFGMSPEVRAQKQAQREKEKRYAISEKIHGTLDAAGMIPVIGFAADGINFLIFTFEGDLAGATFSAIAFIPIIGETATPTKYGSRLALATASSGADNAFRMAGKYSDDAAGFLAESVLRDSDDLITVYRGTDLYLENAIFQETGYLFSEAALPLAYEGYRIDEIFDSANKIHSKWLDNFGGDEIKYAYEHGVKGQELSKIYGLPRTMISVTTSEEIAKKFARDGFVYRAQIPRSQLIKQTILTSTEEEYLIKIGAKFELYK